MSIQAVASVLEADVGHVSAKMLLVCIANAHNTTSGACHPSLERLASESGMSRSSVKRWLRWLEENKYLRVLERRDDTGRQQSHTYVLTLEEGSKLNPSAQDVEEESTVNPREASGEPEEGSNCEPPLKGREEVSRTPQPPLAGGLSFASLWEVWPDEHRGNADNAEGAWNNLAGAAKVRCLAAAPLAVSAFARRKDRFPALVRFIRERTFEEFHEAPDIDGEGAFIVKPGTPEWPLWMGWVRSKHGERGVDSIVKLGYFLTQKRWPEGHQKAAA